jgi:Polysaccharide lyase
MLNLVSAALPVVSVGLMLAACTPVVRDDFTSPTISSANWFVCEREENEFEIINSLGQGVGALITLVRPRPDQRFDSRAGHSGCLQPEVPSHPGSDERAEIWESDRLVQPLGTEVWYRFSMFIDPAVRESSNRLVIGQWKQSGRRSPIVAQRFKGRTFAITVRQDNDAPDRDPEHGECRVVVATDPDAVDRVGVSFGHHYRDRAIHIASASSSGEAMDNYAVAMGMTETDRRQSQPCADLKIESFGMLPVPFGRWTEMIYHIRAATAQNGLLEVWADGRAIVRVTGRIGYRTGESASQYFKFGPYRDYEPHSTFAMLARYRRGPTRATVK